MRITDFHIHPYLTLEENACIYKDNFSLTPEEALKDLKAAGITHICGSVIISGRSFLKEKGFDQLEDLNREALRFKEFCGDYYTPGFHIHPAFPKESMETLEFMHKNGFRLIGELVPYMHGWASYHLDYASKTLKEILDLAGDYHMIVSYHTMNEWQEQMETMISENPKVLFVAAHPGEKPAYQAHLSRIKKYENAYLDLSGTGLFRYGMLAEGIRQVGADRLLFGTDYPITNPGMYVQAVLSEHISDEDREKIFYKNALNILMR